MINTNGRVTRLSGEGAAAALRHSLLFLIYIMHHIFLAHQHLDKNFQLRIFNATWYEHGLS